MEVALRRHSLGATFLSIAAVLFVMGSFATVSSPQQGPAPDGTGARSSPAPPYTRILQRIDVSALPEPLRDKMRSRLVSFEGQPYSGKLNNKFVEAAREVENEVEVGGQVDGATGNAVFVLWLRRDANPLALQSAWSGPQPNFPPSEENRVRAGVGMMILKLIESKPPVYPPKAREAGIQGMVRFNILTDREGRITDLQLVSGHPLLVPAAETAVRQWVFEPTLLDGQPVEVVTQVDVPFTLQ
jgi:TonB family protein